MPVVFVLVLWWRFRKAGRAGRTAWLVAAAVLFVLVVHFLPDPRDRMSGSGAPALGDGMLWGFGTVVVVGVILMIGILVGKAFDGPGVWTFIFTTAALFLGGIFAVVDNTDEPGDQAGPLMTTQIFPETTMRLQGDELTRTSATDLAGCEGRYAGCSRTAQFEYTTTDSDAVTRLEIITFPDNTGAWAASVQTRPSGDPAALVVTNVMREFLLVATVRHADGRAIEPADRPWLRWPAAQLDHAFRDAIGFGDSQPPSANATAAPKTP